MLQQTQIYFLNKKKGISCSSYFIVWRYLECKHEKDWCCDDKMQCSCSAYVKVVVDSSFVAIVVGCNDCSIKRAAYIGKNQSISVCSTRNILDDRVLSLDNECTVNMGWINESTLRNLVDKSSESASDDLITVHQHPRTQLQIKLLTIRFHKERPLLLVHKLLSSPAPTQ